MGYSPDKTTANFATRNKLVSWLVGGLNFQVEHHLFPKISHIHYPAISKIIKRACQEYGIVYLEYPKVRLAVASHVAFPETDGEEIILSQDLKLLERASAMRLFSFIAAQQTLEPKLQNLLFLHLI